MPAGNAYYYNISTRETIWTKPEGQNVRIISQNQLEAVTQIADTTVVPRESSTVAEGVTIKGKDTFETRNASKLKPASHRPLQPLSFMQGSTLGTRLFGEPPRAKQIGGPPVGMLPPKYQNNCGPGSPPWVEKHFHVASHRPLQPDSFMQESSLGTRLFGEPPRTKHIGGPPVGMLLPKYQNNCGPGSPPWAEKHFHVASHRPLQPVSFMQGSSPRTRLFEVPPRVKQIEGPPFGMLPFGYQNNCGPGSPPWVARHFHVDPWRMSSNLMLRVQPPVCAFREPAVKAKVGPKMVAKASEWTKPKPPERRLRYYNKKKEKPKWKMPQPLRDSETAKLATTERISITPVSEVTHSSLNILQNQIFANGDNIPYNVTVVEDDIEKQKNKKKDEKGKEENQQKLKIQDKSRPVSYAPVPKTPWFVVWTGDEKIFFYNPFAGTSIWERPDSLIGRSDVDKIVNNPPNTPIKSSPKNLCASKDSEVERDDYSKRLMVKTHGDSNGAPQVIKIGSDGEAIIKAKVCATKERTKTSLDRRVKSFREMLTEMEVSALSTWEKELPKIVSDPRHLLLTSKEQKQIFEKHLREMILEEYKEKCNRLNEHIDAFQQIVEDLLTTKQDIQVPLTTHNQLVHGNEIGLQNVDMNSGGLQLSSKSPNTLLQIAPNVQLLAYDNTINRTMAIIWNQNSKNQSKITTAATKIF